MDLNNYTLILCTGSPRRHDLFRIAGIPFEVRTKEVAEDYPESLAVDEIAVYLAEKKADAYVSGIADREIILTADTIVAFEGREYGKPASREDSIRTLLELSGKTHEVYTGVCISSLNNRKRLSCRSVVKFADITREEASWYYDNYNPSDKAGSYGIQDWIGNCKVEWINGSYTNILGLPFAQTLNCLAGFVKDKA